VARNASVQIAVAQMAPVSGDLDASVAKVERLHAEAVEGGAELVVFPELALTGYAHPEPEDVALDAADPHFLRLLELSKRAALVIGFVELSPRKRVYNAMALLDGGEVVHVHRKVYLVNYGIWDEKKHYARGKRLQVFPWRGFRVAMFVCYDFWYPSMQHLAATDDADLFVISANSYSDDDSGNRHTWELLTRTPAVLYGNWIVFANRTGQEDHHHFWGGSAIVAPGGLSVTQAGPGEQIITQRCDRQEVARARRALPLLRDADMDFTLNELERIRAKRQEEND